MLLLGATPVAPPETAFLTACAFQNPTVIETEDRVRCVVVVHVEKETDELLHSQILARQGRVVKPP